MSDIIASIGITGYVMIVAALWIVFIYAHWSEKRYRRRFNK